MLQWASEQKFKKKKDSRLIINFFINQMEFFSWYWKCASSTAITKFGKITCRRRQCNANYYTPTVTLQKQQSNSWSVIISIQSESRVMWPEFPSSGPVDTKIELYRRLPWEQDMQGWRGAVGLCLPSDWEPLGTQAGLPDGALKPECDTWAVCHGHRHRQCDTWQDRSWGCNTRSQDLADSKNERHAVQRNNFFESLKSKSGCLLTFFSVSISVRGPLRKSGSRGGWTHQLEQSDETVCLLINSARRVTGGEEKAGRAVMPKSFEGSSDKLLR